MLKDLDQHYKTEEQMPNWCSCTKWSRDLVLILVEIRILKKFLSNRKALPSVVSGYGERSINLNKVVVTFEKHTFLSQTDLTRTGIISNSYN